MTGKLVSTLPHALCGLLLAIPAVAATSTAIRNAWPAETLSGTITTVEPGQKLVIVKGPDGVPFDVVVTPKTRIRSGDRVIAIKELTHYQNKDVSVRFLPERRGDVAESIRIGG